MGNDLDFSDSPEENTTQHKVQNWLNSATHVGSSNESETENESTTTQLDIPNDVPSPVPNVNSSIASFETSPDSELISDDLGISNMNNNNTSLKSVCMSLENKQQINVEVVSHNVPKSGTKSSASSISQESQIHNLDIGQKTANGEALISEQKNTLNRSAILQQLRVLKIPRALNGICKFYYISRCTRPRCTYSHQIHDEIKSKILALDSEDLMNTYRWAQQFEKLFRDTFDFFVRRLARLKCIATLIKVVDDVMTLDIYDRTPFIRNVVVALQYMGFNFNKAIEELISAHGYQNTCLADILLALIVERENELETNWILVQKIIKYRTREIDHGVISDILKVSLKMNSIKLCKSICTDIIKNHSVKFECIDKQIVTNFMTQLASFKLFDFRNMLRDKSGVNPEANQVPYSPTVVHGIVPLGDQSPAGTSTLFSDLSTERLNSVDMDLTQQELKQLFNVIQDNMYLFVNLLQTYKCSCKVDSFAVNTVVFLARGGHLDESYWQMLKHVGEFEYFNKIN